MHPGEADIDNPDPLNISHQVEMWLEEKYWAEVNDIIGSIRQLCNKGSAEEMLAVAKSLDEKNSCKDYTRIYHAVTHIQGKDL